MSRTIPKAYVTAAWSKNPVEAVDQAQKYCRRVAELGKIPVCPILAFNGVFDESDIDSDKKRKEMSEILLKSCKAVIVCGHKRDDIVNEDIGTAKRAKMEVYDLNGAH